MRKNTGNKANTLRRSRNGILAVLLLSLALMGCESQQAAPEQTAEQPQSVEEIASQVESAASEAAETLSEAASEVAGNVESLVSEAAAPAESEAAEAASEFAAPAESAGSEAVEAASEAAGGIGSMVSGAVEAVSEAAEAAGQEPESLYQNIMGQLSQTGGELSAIAAEAAEAARNEDGSFNPEGLKAYGMDLYNAYVSGDNADFGDMEDYFRKIDNTNAAVENYILDRNAGLLKPGEIQILAGGNVYAEDFADLKEFREIYAAIQYNYKKDGNVLRYVDGADDVILFTLREEADGSIKVVDARLAEKGAKEKASLEEMCRELKTSYDEAKEMLDFNRAYDVQDLIDYMKKNPEITGVEYDGKIWSSEELEELETKRLKEIFPEDFE